MTQKVLKVGSSAAVTIPKKSLEELGIKIGDQIYLYIDLPNKRVIISKNKINVSLLSASDSEIIEWTRKFIVKYRKDLEALAKK